MELQDAVTIPAGRETVWQALNDPGILRQCIPGCEELTQGSPTELAARVTLKVGPIKARFAGEVTLSDVHAPEGYVLSGEGRGGVAGFAKGVATVRLEQVSDAETVLHYDARAEVGGKIAQLGSRLLDGTARKLARKFFDDFAALVSAWHNEPNEWAQE